MAAFFLRLQDEQGRETTTERPEGDYGDHGALRLLHWQGKAGCITDAGLVVGGLGLRWTARVFSYSML